MEWLVLIHVLSAVLGLGPAFAFPVLMGKTNTLSDVEKALASVTRLVIFPKLFGT